ncbi:hypothetical protein BpHYR1_015578 [Brachionus plicatilis]|uniref:Uncharacterized protein n=1 Tax=Brachionus plicatilis TaxID=10195 RepID=A0A3M7S509_BRAPC|nr:hypothetical protein BpHYR1_015578 [Brachionus plicatilis]
MTCLLDDTTSSLKIASKKYSRQKIIVNYDLNLKLINELETILIKEKYKKYLLFQHVQYCRVLHILKKNNFILRLARLKSNI